MKKTLVTSLLFFVILFTCRASIQEAAKVDIRSENNETFLQPHSEVQRQKEEGQQNLYNQELVDLRAKLVLET